MAQVVFWGIISLLFLTLVILQLKWHGLKFNPLELDAPSAAKINGISTGITETREWVEGFTESLNSHTKRMSKVQIVGYGATFLAALSSFIESIVNL